jgi:MFS family permease
LQGGFSATTHHRRSAGKVAAVAKQKLTKDQRNSFIAAQLGWTMDAFGYFIVVLVYADIAKTFQVSTTEVAFMTTATLAMRPVGALLFGLWADRIGRRIPLMGKDAKGIAFGTEQSAYLAGAHK